MDRVQCIVVGAGVVGLAVARALASRGREVVVLESEFHIGTGVSSRNSGVIHAGIYYEKNSLKARVCVQGKHALYRFCEEHSVPHARMGKLVVATDAAQLPALQKLRERAREQLGEAYEIRDFHDAVLKNGAVPMEILEEVIDAYIESKKAGAA